MKLDSVSAQTIQTTSSQTRKHLHGVFCTAWRISKNGITGKAYNYSITLFDCKFFKLNSSDDPVVRASASEVVDSGLIPSRVIPMTLKLVFTASLLDVQHYRAVWRTSRQVYLLCRWEDTQRDSPIFVQ